MSFFGNFLDESHLMLRDSCRKFAQREIVPNVAVWEEAGEFPLDLYRKAGQAGILGVGFPEEYGGSGGGALHQVMVIEGLMRGLSTGVSIGLGSIGIGLPPLVQSGQTELIDRVARPVLAGEKIICLAITEPGTGSDVASVQTRARREGEHYVVNGAKMFITSGVRADFLTTLVRTSDDPHGGLTFLLIDRDLPGVHVSEPLKKTGWWASDTAEIGFEDVEVNAANRIGEEGSGFVTLMRNFQSERIALAAYGAVTAEIALEEAGRYARERHVFQKPLAGFQVTRHKLAEMATQVTTAKTMVYQVASRMDAGEYCVGEVSMAKNLSAKIANEVCYEAVQIHGGMGYMRECPVERLSRDARILPIGGGTQEIMKEIIFKNLQF